MKNERIKNENLPTVNCLLHQFTVPTLVIYSSSPKVFLYSKDIRGHISTIFAACEEIRTNSLALLKVLAAIICASIKLVLHSKQYVFTSIIFKLKNNKYKRDTKLAINLNLSWKGPWHSLI